MSDLFKRAVSTLIAITMVATMMLSQALAATEIENGKAVLNTEESVQDTALPGGGADANVPHSGETPVDSGTCGGQANWALYEDGELCISGSGTMAAYYSGSAPWYTHREQVKSIVIEDGITTIGDYAFYDLYTLSDISIPQSVETIGSHFSIQLQ